ncbi:MAG: bacteriohemerythrin [Colwellia sp.]|nr:bacteriohemerythrin [Colwellia sp.]
MAELVWEQGMSVGIDSLDNDHKKLIAILSRLVSAKDENHQKDSIIDIFEKLEYYCQSHFEREETLLASINYQQFDSNKKSHQAFINKIPELKEQWLSAVSEPEAVKEKIVLFLQEWLVKHIQEEALDYASAIHCHQEFKRYTSEKKAQKPWLRAFSVTLSRHVSLSRRVFITTLLPIVAVMVLCFIILNGNYQRYKNINKVLGLTAVIKQVNGINHSLQAERGLSTGYTSSNYRSFSGQLVLRRKNTDTKINSFLWLLEQPDHAEVKQGLSEYTFNMQQAVASLSLYRVQLDKKSASFEDTYHAYTQLIEQLLSVSDRLVHIKIGSSYANDISAINALLRYKEFMGQIRAIGMKMLESNQVSIYNNIDVTLLIGKQINVLKTFDNSANTIQKAMCADKCNVDNQGQQLESLYRTVMQLSDKAARSTQWFSVMSAKVNSLNIVVERLINEFDNKIFKESQRLKLEGYLIIFALSLFLFAAISFTLVLNYSIISPVRKLTYALNEMALGQHNIHFNQIDSKDEIGSMQLAYDKLRRKLLQGDIYKATVSQQQKEIKYRKSQQDHFQQLALTDALTGAVNRHHFNEVLEQEISNVNNHGRALSIMVLDIDYFKKINDSYGHGVGDEVLKLFYQTCLETVRSSDVVARIGGEEFVIIMPNTELVNAERFAERLRNNIAQMVINIAQHKISVTVSIGVSQWKSDYFVNAETFVAHADKSLYQAKNSGRNKVVIAQT